MFRDISFWGIIRDQKQKALSPLPMATNSFIRAQALCLSMFQMSTSFSREGSPTFYWISSPPRHRPIVSGSSHDDHLPILFNEHGQWNGPPNFATLIGEITRSKIGLGYAKWKEVPPEDKEDVWNSVQEKKSPTGQMYRPDVFLKTHRASPDDDPSSSKSQEAAKLALVKEAYDKDPSAQKCLGTDAVTEASGEFVVT
ncbi:hypothetical protein C5167_048246 [Papaver somniferum]|uniref:Uncharacterized protein n=1 Tax=Papaver somniferum TaxID=3469 RepID=A0A4Y7KLK9_PAPSO|nr:hypothetical protein C5167_048246 [Papaver somniferum]